jgi:carbon-monoxide dehydrogenase small subunit
MILSIVALLTEHPDASPAATKAWLRGNICRCTGYGSILEAVRLAQRRAHRTSSAP